MLCDRMAGDRARAVDVGSEILVEQASEVAGEPIVEHADEGVGLRRLNDFEKAFETMIEVVLAD